MSCTTTVIVTDCGVTVQPQNTEAIVKVQNCTTQVIIPFCAPSVPAANPPGWYTLLSYYDTDEEAIGAGLAVGQIYKVKTTGGALGLKRGMIVEIEAI